MLISEPRRLIFCIVAIAIAMCVFCNVASYMQAYVVAIVYTTHIAIAMYLNLLNICFLRRTDIGKKFT